MFSLAKDSSPLKREPPASVGGLSFKRAVKAWANLCSMRLLVQILSGFLLVFSSFTHSALLIEQPPAELSWDGAILPSSSNVNVLRFEKIGFYYYDATSSDSFTLWPGNFADQSSLDGTPNLLTPLPDPLDSEGNVLPFGISLPFSNAVGHEFRADEPIFIIAEGPILPATSFNVRASDGRRFMAVELQLDNGDSQIVSLMETAAGSNDYVGYLQANTPGSSIVIPAGSTMSLVYDNYGDVADSDTVNAPYFVDAQRLSDLTAARTGIISGKALVKPEPEMFLSKQVMRTTAAIGDFLAYELRFENTGIASLNEVRIEDRLPKGFRYQPSSSKVDGETLDDPLVSPDGRVLNYQLKDIKPGDVRVIRYVVEVGVKALDEKAVNIAQAFSEGTSSNVASAEVLIENPFFNDRAFLLGRVLVGTCGDERAQGLEGVRIYMEDGTNVLTDEKGRWHIEGVAPGTHVLQVDTLTLGPRYSLQHCEDNTRKAGNEVSRFVNVQGGTLWRENWYVKKAWHTDSNIEQQLMSEAFQEQAIVRLSVPVRLGEHQFEEVLSQLHVPEGLEVVPGTTTLDGKPVDDLKLRSGLYEMVVKPKGFYARYELGVDIRLAEGVDRNKQVEVKVETSGLSDQGKIFRVSSFNELAIDGMSNSDNEIVFHPKFASLSTELSLEDKQNISNSVESLKGRENLYLEVVGHSDSQRIRYRAGRPFNNNYELSKLRAQSVADYISSLLDMDMDRITVGGVGSDEPIATNATAEGRAKNRRVSLRFRFTEKVGEPVLLVLNSYSGINGDDDGEQGSIAYQLENQGKITAQASGFVNLSKGMTFAQDIFSASAKLDESLKPRLFINGDKVDEGRIGMKMQDPISGLIRYTWVGLDLKVVGDHDIELQGLDNFGIVRFREVVQVRRSGEVKSILTEDVSGNIADGRTPVKVKLKLLDEFSQPISTRVELRIESSQLSPLNIGQRQNPLNDKQNIVQVDGDGYVRFNPVGTAGVYRLTLSNGNGIEENIEIPVAPELREWILVGFAEGTVGYNTLSGNMSALEDEAKHSYTNGESSFFARGQVKGEWLMTMAYDSRREESDNPLMQRIDPQRWYVLYGDDVLRNHDAPSSEKLYLRMEKADFYAMFGDFDTGLSVTELSRFQRTLTGAKLEWKDKNISATGFAAQSTQGFVREDIAGDGTSGLYRLQNKNIVPGSEQVVIETRDRFTNEIITSETKTRYVDYSIDYFDGTLYFREPIFVQDAEFNPVRIVVKYEMDSGVEEVVAGGRVSVHDVDKKIEVGLSAVADNTLGEKGDLGGVDLTWKPDEKHTLKAEAARSQQDDLVNTRIDSRASLAEYTYKSEKFDSRVRLEDQEGGFGLGQQASDDNDIRSSQADARYRISEEFSVSGQALHQERLTTEDDRKVLESRLEYQKPDWMAYSGLRHAEDQVNNTRYESDQVVIGGQRYFLNRRLTLLARGENAFNHNDNIEYPNLLSLGSDYRLNNRVSAFANQDFSWGEERRSQDTRVGLRSSPWQGGTVSTDVSRAQDENGERLLAHAGLYQNIPISKEWTGDFGLDRSQTVQNNQGNPAFDPRQPLSQGTNNDDYTAVSSGLAYQTASWQWTNRLEHRHADTDDKWTVMSGFRQRFDSTDMIAGRVLYFDQQMQSGFSNRAAEIDFSYARRPLANDWFRLNRLRLIMDETEDAFGITKGQRVINNTHINILPSVGQQLSLQYSLRYVRDTIDESRYVGFTDLIGAEYRYDIARQFDLGFRATTMASWNSNIRNNAFGVMAGYTPVKDVWISLGYNFEGFYDQDFDEANTRVKGFVLDFRIKFDQHTARSAWGSGSSAFESWKTRGQTSDETLARPVLISGELDAQAEQPGLEDAQEGGQSE